MYTKRVHFPDTKYEDSRVSKQESVDDSDVL